MFKMDLFGEMPASHGNPEMLIFFTLCVTERSKGRMDNGETNLTLEKLGESKTDSQNKPNLALIIADPIVAKRRHRIGRI